jgi:predicted amidophosphoribosyltransferase
LVRRGKYRPDPACIGDLGRWMAQAARGRLPPVDAVCPVPVPPIRRMRRGFDQAELLARAVAAALQRPMVRPLRRVRQAEQAGRDGWARRHQANQAFLAEGDLSGHILLIDDVITTGATAAACASELLGCGARRVYLFCAVQAGAGDAATPYAEAPNRP